MEETEVRTVNKRVSMIGVFYYWAQKREMWVAVDLFEVTQQILGLVYTDAQSSGREVRPEGAGQRNPIQPCHLLAWTT